ncbi:hypothetical protein BESB_002250 [Besnoitia besnoiti]|uniref:Uncharacterized protein n=1 Tax=Besnoitia besnoiti TaxID=94643 RepID=A0A2A9MKW7_BESBE|nr:hypothetical protein BESB_002250 [Besnoitia besnoiti]PFH37884.1 hypothetical protein BESB_002250 [Besnoitia besnoiti]
MSHTHRGDENTYTQRNPTPLSVVRDPAPSLPEAKVYSAHKGGSRPETLPRSADPATPPPQIASTPAPAPTVSKEKIPFAPTDTSWRSSKYTLEEASQTPTKWEESPVGSPSYPASPAETPSGEKEQWEQPDESDVGETTDEWGRELDALKADEESQTGFDESGQAGDTESERDRIGDGLGNMGKSIQPLVEEAYPDMKLSDEPSPPPVGRHDSEIAATRNFRRQWAPRRYQFGPGETPLPTPPGGSDIDLDNENVIWGELKFQVQDSVADRGRGTPVFAFGHRDPQLMNPEPRKLLQQTTAGAGVPDDGRLECADNHGGSRVGDGVLRANVDDVRDTVAGGTPQQEERYRRGHGAQKGCTQLRTNESDFFQAAAARFQRKDHLSQGLVSPATRTVPLPDSAGAGRLQDEERSTTARILGGPWLFFNADEE